MFSPMGYGSPYFYIFMELLYDAAMTGNKIVLITGASGFLGWHLCRAAAHDWSVAGISCGHAITLPIAHQRQADLSRPGSAVRLVQDIQPAAIIHAAASAQPNYCQAHPDATEKINVDAAAALAQAASDRGIPFVLTSTDLVFDGLAPPYSEDSPVNPVSVYGEQKCRAEEKVLAVHPDAAVCRLPLLCGGSGSHNRGFTHHMIAALKAGQPVRLFTDEYRTPVTAASAARGLLLAIEKARGILHLGGAARLSRFELGRRFARQAGCGLDLIQPIRIQDLPMAAPRPPDVSMDSRKAVALGYRPDTGIPIHPSDAPCYHEEKT